MTETQLRTEMAAQSRADGDRDNLGELNALLREEITARLIGVDMLHINFP